MTIEVHFISIDRFSREERGNTLRTLLLQGARRALQKPTSAVEVADLSPASDSSKVMTLEQHNG